MRATSFLGYSAVLCLTASAGAADWQAIPLDQITKDKPGYGGLSGVLVDHAPGDLYACVSDLGLFHSPLGRGLQTTPQQTWERMEHVPPKGRTEQAGCLQLDPTGKSRRMVLARVYGGPIAVGAADGGDWKTLDNKSSHIDWCAVDWADPDYPFILALKHESGGTLIASADGGKTFDEIGKGYGPGWVFDKTTAVVAEAKTKDRTKPGLVRTTDGGKTFRPCGDYAATALPKWRDGALYWLTSAGLIRTTDAGKTWEKVGDVKDGRYGPIFGKDVKQMFVLTGVGVVESTDGGATWSKPVAPPKGVEVTQLTWLDYDPANDVLYIMKMGSDLYRMERGKK